MKLSKAKLKKAITKQELSKHFSWSDMDDIGRLSEQLEYENEIPFGLYLRGSVDGADWWLQLEYYSKKVCKTIIYDYNALSNFVDIDEYIDYVMDKSVEIEEFENNLSYIKN